MNSKVDSYFNKATKWQEELKKLRSIIIDCGLQEELKWGNPCYMYQENNIVLLHGFKEYCAILFFKGSLLKDSESILIRQTENVQAGRQVRFTAVKDIIDIASTLKDYIHEAIEIEKAGLKVALKKTSEYDTPVEFQNKLNKIPGLKIAFESLTPGRQRAYLFYFSQPKQSKTRDSRIEKHIQHILDGKGLNEA